MKLPVNYDNLTWQQRGVVREQYIVEQKGFCYHCKSCLKQPPPDFITEKKIHWDLFPPNFLKYPVHLHHCHTTGLTIGAVHSYCNAVLWEYYGE